VTVYFIYLFHHSETEIVPSRWTENPKEVLGISIRHCAVKDANDFVWHVQDVFPNSPASAAGLRDNTDYIIASDRFFFQDSEDFFHLIDENLGKALGLWVYNSVSDDIRLVSGACLRANEELTFTRLPSLRIARGVEQVLWGAMWPMGSSIRSPPREGATSSIQKHFQTPHRTLMSPARLPLRPNQFLEALALSLWYLNQHLCSQSLSISSLRRKSDSPPWTSECRRCCPNWKTQMMSLAPQ
jgi:hypothetical protein